MDKNNIKDILNDEYTIVLNGDYMNALKEKALKEKAADSKQPDEEASESRAEIDRLYYEYEKMCLKTPTVLDMDDAYPHSYQWRMGSKYDPAKVRAVEEALKMHTKIADTEAYSRYVEEVSNRSFEPVSWD